MSAMMEYKGYHATVEYDAKDKIFVGDVFGIVDSLNFHGSSVDELEEMFHQSIENYLSICAQCGKDPDKEFKGTFNVRIPADLHRKVSLEAAKQHVALNQYVVRSLEKSFNDSEANETVICLPKVTKHVTWDRESFLPDTGLYEKTITRKIGRKLSYAGNKS